MGKMNRFILCFIIVSVGFVSYAQNNVKVDVDERINQEMRMKNAQIDTNKMEGFRIQIYFGSDMRESIAAMSSFKAKYPDYNRQVYQLYQQPTWKIRVGNFYREIDAQKLLHELREFFPDAFVVKDEISLPPLPSID